MLRAMYDAILVISYILLGVNAYLPMHDTTHEARRFVIQIYSHIGGAKAPRQAASACTQ